MPTHLRYDEKLGRVVEFDGKVEQRSNPLRAADEYRNAPRHFKTTQLPRWYKYHRMAGGEFDAEGNCLFTSRAQIRETLAVANDHGENLTYDG